MQPTKYLLPAAIMTLISIAIILLSVVTTKPKNLYITDLYYFDSTKPVDDKRDELIVFQENITIIDIHTGTKHTVTIYINKKAGKLYALI